MKVSSSAARRMASITGFAESPTMPYTCRIPAASMRSTRCSATFLDMSARHLDADDVGADVAETLVVGTDGHDLIGADVAETLVVGTDGHDLIGADVAETLVVGTDGHDLIGADVAETLVVGTDGHDLIGPSRRLCRSCVAHA